MASLFITSLLCLLNCAIIFAKDNITYYSDLSFQNHSNLYSPLLAWGRNHGVQVNKLRMMFISINEKYYIADEDIQEGEILLSVPSSVFMRVSSVEKLVQVPKLKTALNMIMTKNTTIFKTKTAREQCFLALIQEHSLRKKQGKFYHLFKPLMETFSEDLDNFPVFFDDDEMEILRYTNFGKIAYLSRLSLMEEDKFIKEELNISTITDNYLKQRVQTVSKSYNLDNTSTIVPFADFFKLKSKNASAKWYYNSSIGIFEIGAMKNISKGDVIYLQSQSVPNYHLLLFYGYTEDDNDYYGPFEINLFHPQMRQVRNITMTLYKEKIDIANSTFISESLDVYNVIASNIGFGTGEARGHRILLENLEYYRKDYDNIRPQDYFSKVVSTRNRENIRRIVETEQKILDARIKLVKDIIQSKRKSDL